MLAHGLNLFFPNEHNGYRAHLTKPASIVLAITLLIGIHAGYLMLKNTSSQVLGTTDNLTSATILSLVNLERSQRGLQPLQPHPKLEAAAYNKALDMIQYQYWDHVSQTNKAPWEFIDETGYLYLSAGENLARNFPSSEAVIKGWLESPAHKANLLGSGYTHTGVAVITGELLDNPKAVLIVQLFASPLPEGVTKTNNTFNAAPLISAPEPLLLRLIRRYPQVIKVAIIITIGSFIVSFYIDNTTGKRKRFEEELKRRTTSKESLPTNLWHS